MNSNLVSVIIPTFNRAHILAEAIRSAQAQNYPEKQIIIIDDGSTDNTREVVAQFDGVEYYYQENKGQAAARNLGLSYAKGKYIASLDSDDLWYQNFLSEGIKTLEKHDLDFVFFNWVYLNGESNLMESWKFKKKWRKLLTDSYDNWFLLDSAKLRWLFVQICPSPSSSLLIRRNSIISSWNEEMIIADDWYLILEMIVTKSCRAGFTLTPFWVKRIFGDNVYDGAKLLNVHRSLGVHDGRLMAQKLSQYTTSSEKKVFRKRLADHHLHLGRLTLKYEGFSKDVLNNVVKAFTLNPLGIGHNITQIILDHLSADMKRREQNKVNKSS